MHIHILAIAGTFMGGLAQIAKTLGYKVTGQDLSVYPPMSNQLKKAHINFINGYDAKDLPDADLYVIGNALSRDNDCVEKILYKRLKYTSGAQFLSDYVLHNKWVLAVTGTHGKTTTASMLAWVLEYAKLEPSFLIGGVSQNFKISARLNKSPFFVIEADEYDTAFFDKRSKFVHYKPNTLIINNLEFDHADIFENLNDIKKQFHHLIRIVPKDGLIIYPKNNKNIIDVLSKGCWSELKEIKSNKLKSSVKGSQFEVIIKGKYFGKVDWSLLGTHNMENAMAAIYAAQHVGVPIAISIEALNKFKGIKRRLEVKGKVKNAIVYDDFAHHPTAIKTTIKGLRKKNSDEKIIVILELRSNTMRAGYHKESLVKSLKEADEVLLLKPKVKWDIKGLVKNSNIKLCKSIAVILKNIKLNNDKTHIVVMSNGSFDNIHQKIIDKL